MGGPYSDIYRSFITPIEKHFGKLPPDFSLAVSSPGRFFMPHGMADKTYHNPQKLMQFQHLFYSGPAWKEKLIGLGIPPERIHVVGCPRLDPAFNGEIKRTGAGKTVVAWCPTHNSIPAFSSYPEFESYLNVLRGRYEVVSSVHPYERENRKTSLDIIVNADVVISDTSAVAYETMALGKPVIFLDFLVEKGVMQQGKGTFESYIYANQIGYHAKQFSQIPSLIDRAAAEGLDAKTRAFMEGIFPSSLRGRAGAETAKVLREILG
jgi:hypothetical protein